MTRLGSSAGAVDGGRQRHERRGRTSEMLAAMFLMLKGYRILDRRYRARSGEVDLIAVRGRRVAFVEVKFRASLDTARYAITSRQADRLARTAEQWIWRHPAYRNHQIGLDALLLAPWRMPRHVPNALQRARSC